MRRLLFLTLLLFLAVSAVLAAELNLTVVETVEDAVVPPGAVFHSSAGGWSLYTTAEPTARSVVWDSSEGQLYYANHYRRPGVEPSGVITELPDGGLLCRWTEEELWAVCADPNLYYQRFLPLRSGSVSPFPPRPTADQDELIEYLVNAIRLETIEDFDYDLAAFRTRYAYTEGNQRSQDYLAAKLEEHGFEVTYDSYLSGELSRLDADGQLVAFCGGGYGSQPYCFYSNDGGEGFEFFGSNDEDSVSGWGGVVCFDPGTIHYGAYNTYHRSTDGGATWEDFSVFDGDSEAFMYLFYADVDTGYAFSNAGGIYRTDNGGDDWQLTTSLVNTAQSAASPPGEPLTVIMSAVAGRLFRTTDGGNDWEKVYDSSGSEFFYDVVFADAATALAVGSTVLRTTDGGETWEELTSPLDSGYLRGLLHLGGSSFLAFGEEGAVYRSENTGDSWSEVSEDLGFDIQAAAESDDRIWLLNGQGPAYTDDGGAGAELLSDWLPAEIDRSMLVTNIVGEKAGLVDPDTYVYATAHFDSISFDSDPRELAPGADDNGSGSTVLLELARVLADFSTEKSLRLAFFDAEELGLVGSAYHAARMARSGVSIEGVINLDMVVWSDEPGVQEDLEVFVNDDSEWLGDVWVQACADYGAGLTTNKRFSTGGGSDHYSFWQNGYQATMGIEDAPITYPYYHSKHDDYINLLEHFPLTWQVARGTVAALGRLVGLVEPEGFEGLPEGPYAYPNPFRESRGSRVTFTQLEPLSELSIYDTTGDLLFQAVVPTGEYAWPVMNSSGYKLAAGVYLWTIEAPGGSMTTGRIAVIR